jgi:broad specificity phosphatase PhoE
MNSDEILKVILLRHGETVYNIEKRLQSSKDSLTEKGKNQIKSIADEILKFNFDKIISSDERRAIESAEIISSLKCLKFDINPLIKEKSSGDFADKLVNEVDWSRVKGTFIDKKIPGGESMADVISRADCFLKMLNGLEQSGGVLVISHGTFLRILLCRIFNLDVESYISNYEFPNAEYAVISKNKSGQWKLEKSCLVKREIK